MISASGPGRPFRLLTYNAGLLRLTALGRTLLEVPHLDERRAQLGPALAELGADVLCLQEVFRPKHRAELLATLRPTHPFVARYDGAHPRWTHGLLVLSKFPLQSSSYDPFRAREWWWSVVGVRPGVLSVVVEVPGFGALRVLDVHTTPGGHAGPESPQAERLRARQLDELHRLVLRAPDPVVVCGDLNTGPEASAVNYRGLVDHGYVDAFAAGGGRGATWDPANLLNRSGPHASSPAQRVDHVLLDPRAAMTFRAQSARIVFERPVVEAEGQLVTVSDHHGVLVELRAR